ncbi:hypothetical protein [Aestuariibius sp. HNIBRBA575]|uniref:hypothetical protein n=1 Tax=Aestuariibius sp. HNIBRBA575 TaxID=3233343 RepID=UPI0034A2A2E0
MAHISALASAILTDTKWKRDIRIKPECIPDGFGTQYDFHTLWYDAVQNGSETVLICPKLHNFEDLLCNASLDIDGHTTRIRRIQKFGRHDLIHLTGTGQTLRCHGDHIDVSSGISPDSSARFSGKNIHITMSQNNDPIWIEDFARYHIQHHGLQAMILLDNQSTEQTMQELSDALERSGLEDWLVIPCPFPYGERAIKPFTWRSKFLQTAVYNGVRLRFCKQARAVLNSDLDELVVCDGRSIFDLTVNSRLGFVRFPGVWYSADTLSDRIPRHMDHIAKRTDAPKAAPKYCINPRGPLGRFSWDIHALENMPLTQLWTSKQAKHMHCLNISNGWKAGRNAPFEHRERDPESAALLAATHWAQRSD